MTNQLSDEQISLFTDGKHLGHLVTLMPDGSPQVSPVWVDYRDGLIWINSREGRGKPANVPRHPAGAPARGGGGAVGGGGSGGPGGGAGSTSATPPAVTTDSRSTTTTPPTRG